MHKDVESATLLGRLKTARAAPAVAGYEVRSDVVAAIVLADLKFLHIVPEPQQGEYWLFLKRAWHV